MRTFSFLILGFGVGEFFKPEPNWHVVTVTTMIALIITQIQLATIEFKQ